MINKNFPNYTKERVHGRVLPGQIDKEGKVLNSIYTYPPGGNRASRRLKRNAIQRIK